MVRRRVPISSQRPTKERRHDFHNTNAPLDGAENRAHELAAGSELLMITIEQLVAQAEAHGISGRLDQLGAVRYLAAKLYDDAATLSGQWGELAGEREDQDG